MPAAINWTPELESAICNRIMAGESICRISQDDSMPCESSIWVYAGKNEAFQSAIARAMQIRADSDIERCRGEAERATPADWQVAQLRIRTFQWEAGKRKPKVYGEKVEHSGELALKTVLVESAPKSERDRPPMNPEFDDASSN